MWHPDTTTNAFTRAEYEDMSKAINSAYDIKDAATLNAIEKHGKSYREHLHPQAPLPMVGGQPYQPEEPTADELRARAKKWENIMRAREVYNNRSNLAKFLEVVLDPEIYNPYLITQAWQNGWDYNGGGKNAHAMFIASVWTALLYWLHLQMPGWEHAIIATFPDHAAGLHVSFVAVQITALLAALPFVIPLCMSFCLLATFWGIAYLIFLALYAGLGWCHPWLAPLAYIFAVFGAIYGFGATVKPGHR